MNHQITRVPESFNSLVSTAIAVCMGPLTHGLGAQLKSAVLVWSTCR